MTQFVFLPTATTPFRFQPTLDGNIYTGIVTWNLFGQRWYLNLYAINGTLVLAIPVVPSPADYDISLTKGYFNSTLVFRDASQTFEVSP